MKKTFETDTDSIKSDLRSARKESRDKVAKETGVSNRTIVRYEDGTRVPDILLLAKLLENYGFDSMLIRFK